MVSYPVAKKDPHSHLLFPVIKKVPIEIGEIVGVQLHEGRDIIGVVDEICSDKDHFWLRISPDPNSRRERFSFKIDRVIKLN
jgi:hypothetical protein